jgi:hypothetical protein
VRLREGIGTVAVLIGLALPSVAGLAWQHGGGAVIFGPFAGTNLWLPGYSLWFAVGIALAHALARRANPSPEAGGASCVRPRPAPAPV